MIQIPKSMLRGISNDYSWNNLKHKDEMMWQQEGLVIAADHPTRDDTQIIVKVFDPISVTFRQREVAYTKRASFARYSDPWNRLGSPDLYSYITELGPEREIELDADAIGDSAAKIVDELEQRGIRLYLGCYLFLSTVDNSYKHMLNKSDASWGEYESDDKLLDDLLKEYGDSDLILTVIRRGFHEYQLDPRRSSEVLSSEYKYNILCKANEGLQLDELEQINRLPRKLAFDVADAAFASGSLLDNAYKKEGDGFIPGWYEAKYGLVWVDDTGASGVESFFGGSILRDYDPDNYDPVLIWNNETGFAEDLDNYRLLERVRKGQGGRSMIVMPFVVTRDRNFPNPMQASFIQQQLIDFFSLTKSKRRPSRMVVIYVDGENPRYRLISKD